MLPNILLTGQGARREGLARARAGPSVFCFGASRRLRGVAVVRAPRQLREAGEETGNVNSVGQRRLAEVERGRPIQLPFPANCLIFRNLLLVCRTAVDYLAELSWGF